MKLELVTGCVCDSLNVDGVETVDMPMDKLYEIIHILLKKCDDTSIIQDVIALLIEKMGTTEFSDFPCEECGDYITTSTLII